MFDRKISFLIKYLTSVEVTNNDKHSSLIWDGNNYSSKGLVSKAPGLMQVKSIKAFKEVP